VSEQYWFKPRSVGYGATPITWQGWLLTLGAMAVTTIMIVTAILAEAHRWPHYRFDQAACLFVVVVSLIILIAVSKKRTDGDWRWRW